MQLTALPLAALTLLNAADTPAPAPPAEPQAAIIEIQPFVPPRAQCREYASPTNDESAGQPLFKREPATPDSGQIIYAVDRRIDGCPVIVVKGEPRAAQPLLEPQDGAQQTAHPERGK